MTDPVLLITGASSGIGAATARIAAEAGYRIALGARSEHKLTELVDELGGPDRALAIRCDVKEYAEQKAMMQRVLDHFGQLDAVYANAGMPGSEGGFSGADPEVWREMLLTNVYGVGLTLRCSLEALKASRGHVLLTGSAAGRFVIPGSMYSASKWAVTGMGLSVREELRGTGVRVTLIEPGMVDTPLFDQPPPYALQPEDIARAVVYALSQPSHVDVNEILIRPVPPLADD
ncbi:MAG: SDR family oxidoreductase [Gammaproteobacteria bacterium]|jgi:NADP-dependent 3-hydroxy acid dehydrogenase YdfG|uniref:SDR family oxidoreductase n=1 Tax=Stutzerimonas xanthomarina TaxID=271420 RepID=UPI00190CBD10|nr:SDR family oxidoreductase [Stutzerimonas xanthomarina]MBU0811927.1 SDR family oxidoreductase [Gammaproteobacteria bacterium]MBK3846899.1 SDR family NAD(P)-dependent oxidoreductase [Stutzerimonas xanthomarina]MBU0853892.1 SDR family oxidoreductase [Gammaproteobacteria bacterium]MBU1302802.1 SDR family oxidoreductase [Gammaproteobacteria bacterium]MBU1461290.1 SDR family oxidoreductase [Gammaproteobacteria bacterium]|tara:strand:+ start:6753 stop:7448 length:696 start_codon:yes stop_codon:yes gene_type:complete